MVIPHKDNFSYTEINIKYMTYPIGSMYAILMLTLGGILMGSMLPYIAYMDPMGTMTQHLYYQTSGSRTTPSGVISPMSPEWNLNTAARYGLLKQRKGSTSKALCQPSLSKSAASLDLWKKNMMQKHTKKTYKHIKIQHLINMLHVDQHLKHTSEKLAKPKPSFLQLSSPSCCLLWQLVVARTDGIT